jgi:leucyl aminopeptidase (aminopeptidase T)
MVDLRDAVVTVVDHCLAIRPGENALVVADPGTRTMSAALRQAAADRGADAVLAVMDERATDGTEPPAPVTSALAASDVYIAATTRSLSHTAAQARDRRREPWATMPGLAADTLARAMAVDFGAMAGRSGPSPTC